MPTTHCPDSAPSITKNHLSDFRTHARATSSAVLSNSNKRSGLEVQRKGISILKEHVSLMIPLDKLAKCTVLVDQLCPTVCNPMDCSLPGSSVHGILQSRILE